MDVELAEIEWLIGPDGLALLAEVTRRRDRDEPELRVLEDLRTRGGDRRRAALLLDAAEARRRARERWPDAERIVLLRSALEQASDPAVAAWRARRFVDAAGPVYDLCAGIGGDSLALAEAGVEVVAVDQDAARLRLLEHNARVRGVDVRTRVGDVRQIARPAGSWVHADPGRRQGDRRLRRLGEYQPPVPELLAAHQDAHGVGVVLSPAVDLHDPDLPDGEVEFLQVGQQLTEATVWLGAARDGEALASATLVPHGDRLVRRGPPVPPQLGDPGRYLVSVAPAAVRARLHDDLARQLGARRLSLARSLLTSDDRPPASPWYRTRWIEVILPLRPRVVKAWLRSADDLPLEIAVHGLEADPQRWWQELGRPPRGPVGRRLDLVRTESGGMAVLSTAEDRAPGPG